MTSGHYYFVEKLKIVEKQLCKLNCSHGKVSHALKIKYFNNIILWIDDLIFLIDAKFIGVFF